MSAIDDLYAQIGERIRQAREERGWTQVQLGEAVGFAQATVAHYELGRRHIKLDDLYKIAAALNKPYAYFLGVEKQIEEETRLSLERQLRRDVADFVGVRMLPVLSKAVPMEEPLGPEHIEVMMPVPREWAAEADCILHVKVVSPGAPLVIGDFLFLKRRSPTFPGRVYLAQAGEELSFVTASWTGQHLSGVDPAVRAHSPVIIGELCGLFSRASQAQRPASSTPHPNDEWRDLTPSEREELRQFAQFLLSKRLT